MGIFNLLVIWQCYDLSTFLCQPQAIIDTKLALLLKIREGLLVTEDFSDVNISATENPFMDVHVGGRRVTYRCRMWHREEVGWRVRGSNLGLLNVVLTGCPAGHSCHYHHSKQAKDECENICSEFALDALRLGVLLSIANSVVPADPSELDSLDDRFISSKCRLWDSNLRSHDSACQCLAPAIRAAKRWLDKRLLLKGVGLDNFAELSMM